jgi:polyhydroxyalkanoate synthesis repressor PhaR
MNFVALRNRGRAGLLGVYAHILGGLSALGACGDVRRTIAVADIATECLYGRMASKEHAPPKPETPAESPAAAAPVSIKKYANRRLYHTGTSEYVTLEDLAAMVKAGEDFVVCDAKTGEDITRSVLAQIIFEQEAKGQNLLPVTFMRQLIRLYGDSMQALVPQYLDFSIERLVSEQQKIREQLAHAFGKTPFAAIEEQTRRNMAAFAEALRAMSPFPLPATTAPEPPPERSRPEELDEMRREMEKMRERLERLSGEARPGGKPRG